MPGPSMRASKRGWGWRAHSHSHLIFGPRKDGSPSGGAMRTACTRQETVWPGSLGLSHRATMAHDMSKVIDELHSPAFEGDPIGLVGEAEDAITSLL